ncbi:MULTISPECIES: lipopolysaccharide assembly protein LapA domain-containing protein [Streptosporangium]|uniref:Integral membrane protein n=1 Tax=Streptosporangium brasiliense TaxID=47480 RepID=A0ABT9QVJ1_9ACTN|nr:lipopolysaccharide assembly protein LapA domain-containing protein [Streptosporangium brasiliense]MDP9861009.1 putative integral membrane protein [Streptosporangium brasiliense]
MTRTPADGPRPSGGRLAAISPRGWTALALAALGVIFIAQNRDRVRIQWLTFSVTSPLWTALLAVMLVGVLIGLLLRRRPSKRR